MFFGAWVTVEDEQGDELEYRIVGADELETGKHCISIDSPMAHALLKRAIEDEVRVLTPTGELRYYIIAVRYS